jgi:hypothetical protein
MFACVTLLLNCHMLVQRHGVCSCSSLLMHYINDAPGGAGPHADSNAVHNRVQLKLQDLLCCVF